MPGEEPQLLAERYEAERERQARERPSREQQARLFVTMGALAVTAGLGVAGTVRQDVGGMVLVGGWLLFIIGLHLFGRAASV